MSRKITTMQQEMLDRIKSGRPHQVSIGLGLPLNLVKTVRNFEQFPSKGGSITCYRSVDSIDHPSVNNADGSPFTINELFRIHADGRVEVL